MPIFSVEWMKMNYHCLVHFLAFLFPFVIFVSFGIIITSQDAFYAALIHHIVTIGLVLTSAATGFTRYGGIIMFFFDWADIPLLYAKCCKYLSYDYHDALQWLANRLFELFVIVFVGTRNVYFTYIVYSALVDIEYRTRNSVVCQTMLILLVVLQTYWLGLIVQAIHRQAQNGGHVEDIREEEKNIVKSKQS